MADSRRRLTFQTYNDGVLSVYGIENEALSGNRPKEGLRVRYERLPYELRRAGVQRQYLAAQEGVVIDMLARVPYRPDIVHGNVVIIGDNQYRIIKIEPALLAKPKSMDMTLKRLEVNYDITRLT